MSKVLVVDDSLSVRKVVERALAGRQIDVVCAASGSEALERLERDAPDVVVCDVVMPDRDGYEICEFIKSHPRLAHTPVLLMSGIVNDEVRARAAQAKSAGILAKPFAADDLVRHLDSLLAARLAAPAPVPVRATPPPIEMPAPPREAPAARREALRPERVPVAAPAPIGDNAAAVLAQFGAMDGVQWAVLADREGFVIEATANAGVDADVAGALGACLAESSDGLGRELGRGALQGVILEYEKGMVVLYGVGSVGLLAVGITEPSVLGKVRYFARRALPELARVM
ncbi:MAG TPA: response regulator [Methylomirabilota bacterium]|jgi:CheY-like chemotaxis protein/predicted regulator of Ras-like GTPase activity (Roadblock/LC7/MglB family)|nr:response regulator [Methylomirabilota bacterium]